MIQAMPALPPLAAIRAFEAAARHANYTRAAEELGMTQAGVSYQIRLLEQRVGAPLFLREGRRMVLTAAGAAIAPRVSEAFAALDEAFRNLRERSDAILTISCPRTFASAILARSLGAFQIAHPEIAVRLDVRDELVDLSAGEVDVAVRGIIAPGPGQEAHYLMRQRLTPMASPAFLARHPVREPRDVLKLPRLSPDDEWWDLWLAAHALPHEPQTGVRFDSQVLDGQAAMAGHGLAILSPIMFVEELADGRLVQPLASTAKDPRSFWVVYPEAARHARKIRMFRDWVIALVRERAGPGDPLGVLEAPEE